MEPKIQPGGSYIQGGWGLATPKFSFVLLDGVTMKCGRRFVRGLVFSGYYGVPTV